MVSQSCCNTFSTLAKNKIEIQKYTPTTTALGGFSETWATEYTVYAIIRPLSGRETIVHEHLESNVNAEIIIRYKSALANTLTTAERRIKFGSRYYNILSVRNVSSSLSISGAASSTVGLYEGKDYQILSCTETQEKLG